MHQRKCKYTLFPKKHKMESLIFPGAQGQGQGPVNLDHVEYRTWCLFDITQGHMTLNLDPGKNR